jgi:DNA primase
MGGVTSWLEQGFKPLSSQHKKYLKKRGVDRNSSVSFYTWDSPKSSCPCERFIANFGYTGRRLQGNLITPIYSPRGALLGMEARHLDHGNKKVLQYRTDQAQWNPYFLGAPKAFETLYEGYDLWVVEGIFDMIALEKVVPNSDAVISTLRAGMDNNSVNMISRFLTPRNSIYIAYDNDETGRKKADWLKAKLTALGGRVYLCNYRGKDPNEVWSTGGEALMRRYFS